MKNAKHIVKTVLFCGTLAVFSAVSVFSPKEKGSFYENRRLAVFPVPSVETVLDGTFFSDVETYISDHFACRVPLLRLNVRKELALHNPVVSNTVIAGDTLLPYHGKPRTDYDHENMQTVLDALSQVSAACETVGAKFVYLSIPEQSSALRYKYPSYLTSGTYTDDSMRTDFLAGLDARGIDCLNMAEYLCTDPEMGYICGLTQAPVFVPIVGDFYKGMATTVMLPGVDAHRVHETLMKHYEGQQLVTVAPFGGVEPMIYANTLAGHDSLKLIVCGHEEQTIVTALFDNLGKGASGAAVQNMNIMLGLDETTGLNL